MWCELTAKHLVPTSRSGCRWQQNAPSPPSWGIKKTDGCVPRVQQTEVLQHMTSSRSLCGWTHTFTTIKWIIEKNIQWCGREPTVELCFVFSSVQVAPRADSQCAVHCIVVKSTCFCSPLIRLATDTFSLLPLWLICTWVEVTSYFSCSQTQTNWASKTHSLSLCKEENRFISHQMLQTSRGFFSLLQNSSSQISNRFGEKKHNHSPG